MPSWKSSDWEVAIVSQAWWTDALNDPWRDPATPAVVRSQLPAPPPPPGPEPDLGQPTRFGLRHIVLVAIVAGLLAGALGGAVGFLAANRQPHPSVVLGATPAGTSLAGQRPPDSLAGVVSRVLPTVVTVHGTGDQGESLGSGFVISADGYVLTNDHVVEGVPDDSLTVTFADASTVPGKIVGRDPESDLAVIKAQRSKLAAVVFGDSDRVSVGDPVLAVGAPLALSGTVTFGIISALDRPIETGDAGGTARYYAAIQTDAAVNHGNSGGPLFDASGQVIGVNSVIKSLAGSESEAGNIGLAFAIPINQARRVAAEIIDTGRARRTVIGAQLELSFRSSTGGVRLLGVDQGGPAAEAGLRAGDVITRLGAHPIAEPTDLIALVRRYDPGTVMSVQFKRNGATQTTQVTLVADAE